MGFLISIYFNVLPYVYLFGIYMVYSYHYNYFKGGRIFMLKKLLDYDFEFVQNINPILDNDGNIKVFYPQERYNKRDELELNEYGSGSFCKFSIHPKWFGVSGVYSIFINDKLVYIGKTLNLGKRFNAGYGTISPRNCFVGGQTSNCKINNLILNSVAASKIVTIYFHYTNNYNEIEKILISHYNPKFNVALTNNNQKCKYITLNREKKIRGINKISDSHKNPSISEVREYINQIIINAREEGRTEIVIKSGDIHNKLYMKNAMPTVCSAMRTLNGNYEYEIVEEPPKENGSRLIFKYFLLS